MPKEGRHTGLEPHGPAAGALSSFAADALRFIRDGGI